MKELYEMRFMMMVKGDRNYEAGRPPDPRLVAEMGKLTEEMFESGVMQMTDGLAPSSKGALVTVTNGRQTVTDGPFSEAKEVVGGFAIVKVGSKAEAIELGRRFMKLHQDILGPAWEGQCEIRQMCEF
jgi:hypothetical protein